MSKIVKKFDIARVVAFPSHLLAYFQTLPIFKYPSLLPPCSRVALLPVVLFAKHPAIVKQQGY